MLEAPAGGGTGAALDCGVVADTAAVPAKRAAMALALAMASSAADGMAGCWGIGALEDAAAIGATQQMPIAKNGACGGAAKNGE